MLNLSSGVAVNAAWQCPLTGHSAWLPSPPPAETRKMPFGRGAFANGAIFSLKTPEPSDCECAPCGLIRLNQRPSIRGES